METAFRHDRADFSRLGSFEAGNIYISQVLHRTFLSVGEKGTRAGAAASVAMNATSAAPEEEPKAVILDRPFLYAIWDTEEDLPIFLGVLADPASAK